MKYAFNRVFQSFKIAVCLANNFADILNKNHGEKTTSLFTRT